MKKILFSITSILLVLMFFIAVTQVEAGSIKRRGTAGAMELLIPVGSRATALGGNFIAAITGTEAIYWNPAGLAGMESSVELMVSHFKYIADINVEYVSFGTKLGKIGALGLSVKTLDLGEIPVTTSASPEGTGQTFNPSFVTLGLTFSRRMTDRILFGVTAKLITEKIMNESANGMAFDFGVQYLTGANIRIGVALKNLGPNMKFNGPDPEVRAIIGSDPNSRSKPMRAPLASFELPSTMELGISYDLNFNEIGMLTVAGNFMNHNFGLDQYGLAAEYNYNDRFFLRGGYSLGHNPDKGSFEASNDDFLFGPSFGAGVKLDLGVVGFNFDYAYRTAELFDDNQWITVTLAF